MSLLKKYFIAIAFTFSLYGLTSCGPTTFVTAGVEYSNPAWAPPYYSGARYYYFPDIETYYDLSTQEFAYLNGGQWLFSPGLPSIYSGYDLYGGFVVTLNRSVYQPWMHHQYYVSHYPRYYYRTTYRDADITTIRGFNENERKPIMWRQEDRTRTNDTRRTDQVPVRKPDQTTTKPQNSNYYGKQIGQPVKVKSHMRENKPTNNQSKKSNNKKHGKH